MKVALVGIGKIACDQHIPNITSSPDWELAATVSRNATVGDVESYTSFDEMLQARPDIQVVSLTMPPKPRFEYAAKALMAGRHVMLEKPPGASLSECQALERLAKELGLSIFATWHSRFATCIPVAKNWLAKRHLKRLEIIWKEDVRKWHPGQDWIWEPGGMGVFDPGINALSILTEILSDPVHVTEATLDIPSNCQTPIAAKLQFAHPLGANVSAEFDWLQTGTQTWTIEAETDDGTMVLSSGGAVLHVDGVEIAADDDREYARLYERMFALVQSGQSEMDLSPLVHVADAFMLGRRKTVDPFHF